MFRLIDRLRKHRRKSAPPPPGPAAARLLDAFASETAAANGAGRSILFLTTHKCASTFVSKLLDAVAEHAGFRHYDYATAMWRLGNAVDIANPELFASRNHGLMFHPQGEIYGPLRRPVSFPGRETFRHVFFLRDPRDLLVSNYYSLGFSHALPASDARRAEQLERRERVRGMGIDAYCLEAAESWIGPTFAEYARMRDTSGTAHVYLYDTYKDDPLGFLKGLRADLDLAVGDAVLAALARAADPVTAPSDGPLRHKRSGASGQFRTELRPETVAALEARLAPILDAWGFAR